MRVVKPILISLLALVVLSTMVTGVVDETISPGKKGGKVQISGLTFSNGEKVVDPSTTDNAPPKPALARIQDLIRRRGQDNIAKLKNKAVQDGLLANLQLFQHTANRRTQWLEHTNRIIQFACLLSLLLVLGPFWIRRRLHEQSDRNQRAWQSVPYFLVLSAATLFITKEVVQLVFNLQMMQVVVASVGSPPIALTNDFMLYFLWMGDAKLAMVDQLTTQTEALARTDPMAAFGVVQHLFSGMEQARDSTLLGAGFRVAGWSSNLISLYGPILAAATLVLLYGIMAPLIREVLRVPMAVAEGTEEMQIWPLVKSVLVIFWREFIAMFTTILFLMFILFFGAIFVHLLCFPLLVAGIEDVSASLQIVMASGTFPDTALFFSLLSMVIYLLLGFTLVMVPLGLAAKQTFLVTRHKGRHKEKFRSYANYRSLMRIVFARLIPRTFLCACISSLAYGLGLYAFSSPHFIVWWSAISFCPLFLVSLWLFKPGAGLWKSYKDDPILTVHAATEAIAVSS